VEIAGPRIREGFPGQRSVVLPRPIAVSWLASGPLIDVLPSDVGFYPHAKWHFVERTEGISQAIIIYCADGDGWAQIGNGDVFPVRSGHALIIPRDTIHAYGADPAAPWTIYWVHISGPKAATLLRLLEVDPALPTLFLGRDPGLASLFEKILSILGRGYSPDSLLQASMALGQLITHFVVNRYRQPNNDAAVDERIERVIDRMHKNLSETFHIDDLASDAHLSRSHFAAVFRRRTGFSVLDFFTRLKMQRACFLLDTTDMPIKAIAADLGFDDPLYFSRSFRRIHDLSPLQYRAIRKG
jgi:AraC-like DNA-binding protein